jgi:hypothetical protein
MSKSCPSRALCRPHVAIAAIPVVLMAFRAAADESGAQAPEGAVDDVTVILRWSAPTPVARLTLNP